jgi:hypothetical protein
MSVLEDEFTVRRLIAKFANSFDVQAWDELSECLADSIYTDYSESRGTLPDSIGRNEFVQARRASLQNVKMHHLTGNVEVYINGTSATARVSALIFRRNEEGEVSRSHCLYLLGFQSVEERWSICSMVLRVLWSEAAST